MSFMYWSLVIFEDFQNVVLLDDHQSEELIASIQLQYIVLSFV